MLALISSWKNQLGAKKMCKHIDLDGVMKKACSSCWWWAFFSYSQASQGLAQTFAIQLIFPGSVPYWLSLQLFIRSVP